MLKKIKVSQLQEWDKNPREISEEKLEALKKYIKKYGLLSPLLVDGRDGKTVLGGNMRLRALRELGIEEVEVKIVHPKNDDEAVEIALLDNASFGRYIKSRLREVLRDVEIDVRGVDVPLEFDIAENFKPVLSINRVDEVPEVDFELRLEEGTLFELGSDVRLLYGDATKEGSYAKLFIGSEPAKMILTDPPYNIDYSGNMNAKRRRIENDNMDAAAFAAFLLDFLQATKPHVIGAWYIFMSSQELPTLYRAFVQAGLHWHEYVIWVKDHFTLSRTDYKQQFEPLLVGETKAGIGEFILYGWNKHRWYGNQKTPNVLYFPRPKKSELHPTQKPVDLLKLLILNSSIHSDIVLDPFAGSGSTMVACLETGRKSYNIELDPLYVSTIIERYLALTGEAEIRVNGESVVWQEYKEAKMVK